MVPGEVLWGTSKNMEVAGGALHAPEAASEIILCIAGSWENFLVLDRTGAPNLRSETR